VRCGGWKACEIDQIGALQFLRQAADDLYAGDTHQLADRLNSDLGLTGCDGLADRWGRSGAPGNRPQLSFQIARNTEALEYFCEMDAAGAPASRVGVSDRSGHEQRPPKPRYRTDIGVRHALFDRCSDRGTADQRDAFPGDLAVAFERLDARLGQDRHIDRLAGGDALLDPAGGGEVEHQTVPGRLL